MLDTSNTNLHITDVYPLTYIESGSETSEELFQNEDASDPDEYLYVVAPKRPTSIPYGA